MTPMSDWMWWVIWGVACAPIVIVTLINVAVLVRGDIVERRKNHPPEDS